MRISDWSSDVCSSDLSSTWWFLVLPGQWCASVPARQVDAACDAAVVDVAAAGRAHGEVAARAIDFDVARTDRADRDAAADIFQVEVAGTDRANLYRALRGADRHVARPASAAPRQLGSGSCRERVYQ